MSTSLSPRRYALAVAHLLFSAVLLASVSNAWAGNITYNIVNYPAYETDSTTDDIDTITGTIVTDGAIGPLAISDIVGGSFTLTNPEYGTFTTPILGYTTLSGIV